jgi:hypothetical protein
MERLLAAFTLVALLLLALLLAMPLTGCLHRNHSLLDHLREKNAPVVIHVHCSCQEQEKEKEK